MKPRYKSAYIIPKGTKKTLTQWGWDFDTKNRIPNLLEKIVSNNIPFLEEYTETTVYENDQLKIDFMKDSFSNIEIVWLRFYGIDPELPTFLIMKMSWIV